MNRKKHLLERIVMCNTPQFFSKAFTLTTSRNTEGAKPPPFSDVGNHPPFATALAGILGPQPESLYWDNDRGVLADPNCSTAGKYLQQDSVEPPPLVTVWRAGLVNVSNVRSSPLHYCTAVNDMPPSWHWLQSEVRSALLYGPDLSAPFAKFFQNWYACGNEKRIIDGLMASPLSFTAVLFWYIYDTAFHRGSL